MCDLAWNKRRQTVQQTHRKIPMKQEKKKGGTGFGTGYVPTKHAKTPKG